MSTTSTAMSQNLPQPEGASTSDPSTDTDQKKYMKMSSNNAKTSGDTVKTAKEQGKELQDIASISKASATPVPQRAPKGAIVTDFQALALGLGHPWEKIRFPAFSDAHLRVLSDLNKQKLKQDKKDAEDRPLLTWEVARELSKEQIRGYYLGLSIEQVTNCILSPRAVEYLIKMKNEYHTPKEISDAFERIKNYRRIHFEGLELGLSDEQVRDQRFSDMHIQFLKKGFQIEEVIGLTEQQLQLLGIGVDRDTILSSPALDYPVMNMLIRKPSVAMYRLLKNLNGRQVELIERGASLKTVSEYKIASEDYRLVECYKAGYKLEDIIDLNENERSLLLLKIPGFDLDFLKKNKASHQSDYYSLIEIIKKGYTPKDIADLIKAKATIAVQLLSELQPGEISVQAVIKVGEEDDNRLMHMRDLLGRFKISQLIHLKIRQLRALRQGVAYDLVTSKDFNENAADILHIGYKYPEVKDLTPYQIVAIESYYERFNEKLPIARLKQNFTIMHSLAIAGGYSMDALDKNGPMSAHQVLDWLLQQEGPKAEKDLSKADRDSTVLLQGPRGVGKTTSPQNMKVADDLPLPQPFSEVAHSQSGGNNVIHGFQAERRPLLAERFTKDGVYHVSSMLAFSKSALEAVTTVSSSGQSQAAISASASSSAGTVASPVSTASSSSSSLTAAGSSTVSTVSGSISTANGTVSISIAEPAKTKAEAEKPEGSKTTVTAKK